MKEINEKKCILFNGINDRYCDFGAFGLAYHA